MKRLRAFLLKLGDDLKIGLLTLCWLLIADKRARIVGALLALALVVGHFHACGVPD